MIKWTQMQEQPPPDGVCVLATDGRLWEKARCYRGAWRDWGHRVQPTHWAPINLPVEQVRTCKNCKHNYLVEKSDPPCEMCDESIGWEPMT